MKQFILNALAEIQNGYSLCGVVDRRARVYPLGSDTKVISTLFEIVARQAVASYAGSVGLQLVEPEKQNHYPDFTWRGYKRTNQERQSTYSNIREFRARRTP